MAKKRTASPLPDSKTKKRAKQPKEKETKSAATSIKAADEHAIHEMLVQKFNTGTVKKEAAVFLSGVLKYLAVEILEQSVNVARNRSNSQSGALKVTLGDTMEAIETDPDMKELIQRARKINSDDEK